MKKISRIIASIMLVVAIAFLCFALTHPELSWSWSNAVSYTLYLIYTLVMVVLFIAPFKNKEN